MDVEKILEKASDQLSVRRAFGPAYEKNGLLIIPVALVAGGGGGGMARPGRANPAAHTDTPSKEAGPADASSMDAGGGFGGLVLPVGVYVVKDDQVRWVSAVDVTIAVLASLALARTLVRSWTRRPRRSGRPGLHRTPDLAAARAISQQRPHLSHRPHWPLPVMPSFGACGPQALPRASPFLR